MNAKTTPLNEVRETLSVQWYRCPISNERLRELSRRSDLKGWIQAGGHRAQRGSLQWVINY